MISLLRHLLFSVFNLQSF